MEDYIKKLRKRIGHEPIIVPHAVVLLFNEKEEILLEERKDDGFFDFPGGGVDLHEEVEEAAIRELKEETGLDALELELFKIYSGDITYYKYPNGDEIYGIDVIYIVRKYKGNLIPQKEEVKSLGFYDLNKLPEPISKRNKKIISDYLSRK